MPDRITIITRILGRADKIDFLKHEFLKLIEMTRSESGCVQYELHQDNQNPALFLFFQKWLSRDHWQAHINNKHLKQCLENTNGAIEEITMNEMTERS